MSISRKCPDSGAIIFDLTPEEVEIRDSKAEIDQMKSDLADKLSQADALLKKLNSKK